MALADFDLRRPLQALRRDELRGVFDPWLAGATLLLAAFGLIMVASSSSAIAEGMSVGPFHYLIRHVVFLILGTVLAAALMTVPLDYWQQRARLLLSIAFLMLLLVFVPGIGRRVNGATRWINLGISSFQVVEAVKLLLIAYLASYLVRFRHQVRTEFIGLLKPLAIAAGMVGLLLLQPDFGSAVLLLVIAVGMVWLGGARLRHLLLPCALGLPVLAWLATTESYRMRRLTSFLDPWQDPFNDGFQLTQALIAIGRGAWTGVGLGGSVQKLFYLPEAHTDFILAVVAEELGLIGVVLVLTLFGFLCGRLFTLALRAIDRGLAFGGYCLFGIALWIGTQALVSIGVNLGVLPTKGLTLPLISSGGSSLMMTVAALGLALRVSFELARREAELAVSLHGVPQQEIYRGPVVAVPAAVRTEPAAASMQHRFSQFFVPAAVRTEPAAASMQHRFSQFFVPAAVRTEPAAASMQHRFSQFFVPAAVRTEPAAASMQHRFSQLFASAKVREKPSVAAVRQGSWWRLPALEQPRTEPHFGAAVDVSLPRKTSHEARA